MSKLFIGFVQSCNNCGNLIAVKKFNNYPTQEELKELSNSIGGMYCIQEYIFELEDDEIFKVNDF